MSDLIIIAPTLQDLPRIEALYHAVAKIEGGLARTDDEVSADYVRHNLEASMSRGLSLVALMNDEIIGEIHAYRPVPKVFAHVLSDLTIAVHPAQQKLGVGRALFSRFLETVRNQHPEILRIELIARESNQRAIGFYQTLGFEIEGCFKNRIRSVGGGFESDIPMAWHR